MLIWLVLFGPRKMVPCFAAKVASRTGRVYDVRVGTVCIFFWLAFREVAFGRPEAKFVFLHASVLRIWISILEAQP